MSEVFKTDINGKTWVGRKPDDVSCTPESGGWVCTFGRADYCVNYDEGVCHCKEYCNYKKPNDMVSGGAHKH
jgi:hypothetical protein